MQDCVLLDDVVPIDVASLAHLSVLQSLSGILFEDNNCAGTLAFGDIGNALLDAFGCVLAVSLCGASTSFSDSLPEQVTDDSE